MDKKGQSKKDEIILQQLEVIRSMTEHNLSRMGTDFWGAPAPEKKTPASREKPASPGPEKKGGAPGSGTEQAPEAAEDPVRLSSRSMAQPSAITAPVKPISSRRTFFSSQGFPWQNTPSISL